jgi:hypothetical protein
MYEVWRPVPDWEGLYEASSLGNVRSLPRQRNGRTYAGRLLKPTLNPRYLVVGISDATTGRRKSTPVHVLVAAAFLGPRPKGGVTARSRKTSTTSIETARVSLGNDADAPNSLLLK